MKRKRATKAEIEERLVLLADGKKFCENCAQIKSIDEFAKDPRHYDGLQTYCKDCYNLLRREKWGDKVRATAREHHQKIKDTVNPKKREYMRQNKERFAEGHKTWLAANREHVLTQKKARHAAHRDEDNAKAKIRAREWYQANPEKAYENVMRRMAKLKNAEGSHTLAQWHKLLDLCDHKCVFCGSEQNLTRDHIIPLDWDGNDYIENIQPLCKSCNSIKRHYFAVDYRPIQARIWAYAETYGGIDMFSISGDCLDC